MFLSSREWLQTFSFLTGPKRRSFGVQVNEVVLVNSEFFVRYERRDG